MQTRLLCAAVMASVSPVALATGPAPTQASPLQPVVVTATRVDQPVTDTLVPVSVITRADIQRLQPRTIRDLLDGQAGISLANSGGPGQLTTLYMRGTGGSHALVLIDGVRYESVDSGVAAWSQIPVDQIQRIEIVRGPRSSLYGADAVGGVIQIFTRHGKAGEGLQPSLRVSGGSHNTWNGQVGLSGGSEHAWFNASVGAKYTRGINSCKRGAAEAFAGCFADEPDKDGYRAYNGLLSGGYRWDSGAQLTADFLRTTGYVEYDGSVQNYGRQAEQVEGAKLTLPATGGWNMQFEAGRTLDKTTSYKGRSYTGDFDSTLDQVSWINAFTLDSDQSLHAGVDWQRDHLVGDPAYTRSTRDNTGVFAQYQGRFGAHQLEVSARQDHNQQFGDHTTGGIAWGYHFGDGPTLSASWASAFHAPTFNDLYSPFTGFSNPDLAPEKSRNLELDLAARHAHWHWQLSAYRNTIDDLIVNYPPQNIGKARILGLDGDVGGHWRQWRWKADITWLKPTNEGGGVDDGNILPRRPTRSLRIDLDRQWGDFSAGVTFKAFSHRYDDAANIHRLGGYGLLSLRGSWNFAAHWQLQANLDNAFDHDYETVYYYNQPGRTAMLTLRYRP